MKAGKKMSAEARKRISEAQKARWAAKKTADKTAKELPKTNAEVANQVGYSANVGYARLPFVAYVNPLQRKLDIIKQILEL